LIKDWDHKYGQRRTQSHMVVDQVHTILGIGAADLWRSLLFVFLTPSYKNWRFYEIL